MWGTISVPLYCVTLYIAFYSIDDIKEIITITALIKILLIATTETNWSEFTKTRKLSSETGQLGLSYD